MLTADVTDEPLVPSGGLLPVRRAAPDPGPGSAWEADPAPWRARVLAAAEFLDR